MTNLGAQQQLSTQHMFVFSVLLADGCLSLQHIVVSMFSVQQKQCKAWYAPSDPPAFCFLLHCPNRQYVLAATPTQPGVVQVEAKLTRPDANPDNSQATSSVAVAPQCVAGTCCTPEGFFSNSSTKCR